VASFLLPCVAGDSRHAHKGRVIPQQRHISALLSSRRHTGLRRNEACQLEWANVDLVGKTMKVVDTKNHLDHILPISDFLFNVLKKRWNERDLKRYPSARRFVFPSTGKTGYLIEPKKAIAQVVTESEVQFMIHDLRRTFLTIEEGLDVRIML
jgi:integrase